MSTEVYRVADYIADFISDLGVRDVFLLPGGGAMHLVDAAGKHPKLNVISCLHEQAAGIAAEAYGRIHPSGIGVAIVTTGPGATNIITPVAGAWIESVPMLIVSGQVKRADMLNGSPLRQKGVQEVDIVGMVRGVTKYAKTITDVSSIRSELEWALHCAREGRAGPVWLDIPLDVQGSPVNPTDLYGFDQLPCVEVGIENGEQERSILEMIRAAKQPLVLAGHGVRLAGAAERFRQVVEKLGVPVVTTWNALDLLPYDHPLYVGRPGVVALRAPNFAVQNCDLLISIGCRLDNVITAYNPKQFAPRARKIVIDVDPFEIEKLEMDIELSVQADANIFLSKLQAQLENTDIPMLRHWIERCLDWKHRYPINDGKPFDVNDEISHFRLVDALSAVLPCNSLVATGSSGLAIEAFYTAFKNKEGQRVFLTSGLGSMGYGLPAAIGACVANGRRRTFAIESDGSLQLNLQELMTLKSYNLPICLIVLNNNGYCSIRNTQKGYFDGRFVGTGPESGMLLPDLRAVAAAFGLTYRQVSSPQTVEVDLRAAIEVDGPVLVEVNLVSEELLSPKVSAIPQADGSIMSMPLEDMSPLLDIDVLAAEMSGAVAPQSMAARLQVRS